MDDTTSLRLLDEVAKIAKHLQDIAARLESIGHAISYQERNDQHAADAITRVETTMATVRAEQQRIAEEARRAIPGE